MAQITTSELERMIRSKIKEKGLGTDITEDKIREIKNKIRSEIRKGSPTVKAKEETIIDIPAELPSDEPGRIPQAVTTITTTDAKAIEIAKKEGELSQKEKEISKREADVTNREAKLQKKEEELTYKPQIPTVLEQIGPEKLFIFDVNEISLGAEAMSKTPLRLVANPDTKKSIHDLWIEAGVRRAEVYIAKFEKIGEMTFDPFQGTTIFEHGKNSVPKQETSVPADGLTPEDAKKSQEPSEPMKDSIEPIKDVSLPMTSDMGLNMVDVRSVIEKKVEDILRNYLLSNRK